MSPTTLMPKARSAVVSRRARPTAARNGSCSHGATCTACSTVRGAEPDCFFFTKAYMGLKAGDDPTGRFPGTDDPEFADWCRAFLAEQVAVTTPRDIATLGTDARRFLATMATDLPEWSAARNPEPAAVEATIAGHRLSAVSLLHPSGCHASLGRRSFGVHTGLMAEAALLETVGKQQGRLDTSWTPTRPVRCSSSPPKRCMTPTTPRGERERDH